MPVNKMPRRGRFKNPVVTKPQAETQPVVPGKPMVRAIQPVARAKPRAVGVQPLTGGRVARDAEFQPRFKDKKAKY